MAGLWHWVNQIVLIAMHWENIFNAIMGGPAGGRH